MESSGRQLSKNTKYVNVHALLGKKVRYQPVGTLFIIGSLLEKIKIGSFSEESIMRMGRRMEVWSANLGLAMSNKWKKYGFSSGYVELPSKVECLWTMCWNRLR